MPGLGPRAGVPKLSPSVDWSSLQLDDLKGFVLSRVDGRTTLAEIVLLTPFPEGQTVAILNELFARGVINIPGVPKPMRPPLPGTTEASPPPPPREPERAPAPVVPVRVAVKPSSHIAAGTGELTPEAKRRIDEVHALVGGEATPAGAARLLGVAPGADKKAVKRAYFALSKEFHPDRFFRKNIGDYERKLAQVFNAVKEAYETLDGAARR